MQPWVRDARPEDAARMVAMIHEMGRFEGKPPSGVTTASFLRDCFGARAWVGCLVAGLETIPIGFAIYHPTYDTNTPSRGLHLADLFVEAHMRRRGIGKALIKALAQRCVAEGGEWLSLHTRTDNRNARAVYARLGAIDQGLRFMSFDDAAFATLARDQDGFIAT
jgi:ribosomal protein S18 acetylase RimI-like enzyme